VQIVLKLEWIFIFRKSSTTNAGRIPFTMYWIGVQTEELGFVVNLGKYNVISIGNSALMPKFVVSDRRKFKEDLDMSAHC